MTQIPRSSADPMTDCRQCIIGGERSGRSSPPQHQPGTVFFASLSSLAAVLSDENRELLRMLRQREPQSLTQLSLYSGRTVPSLSRTLKMMESYGLVHLARAGAAVIPTALATRFTILLE